jgi:hypothetical protein
VRDVRATARLLCEVLGLRVQFEYGEPTSFVRIGPTVWSGSGGIDIGQSENPPTTFVAEIGIPTDECYQRALASGVETEGPPEDMPWPRREFTLLLPEGHRIRVSGPTRPPG